ncbi:MAG: hypothetical protein KJ747_11490 [Actinobacteria bacterium]|nr:hypothetical protein [Actinomycetota bacterium]MDP2232715.1 hypothetical protein [Actinomycetota bacterium]
MITRITAIASAVFLDAMRRKVVWVVLLFSAVLAVAIPALPSYGAGVVQAVYREVALALVYAALVAVTLALAANRVPGEIERRTIYNVLARGVPRWEYLVGTWAGIVVTVGIVGLSFAAVAIGVGFVTYGTVMFTLLEGVFAIWLEAGVLAAFCMAVASVSGAVVVSVASLAFLFVTHARAGLFTPDTLGWKLYPSLDTFNIITPVAHGSGVSAGYLLLAVVVFAAWSGILLLISSAAFARRDL